MMLPSADTLAIRQLHIRRSGTGATLRRAAVDHVQQQLNSADWPDPGKAWVFIRSMQVKGTVDSVGQHLISATRDCLQHNDSQQVVRFAHLGELLAALIADLLKGQALQRWYWQRWADLLRLPLPQALAHLLADHPGQLPGLCARLDQQHLLPRFFNALSETTADQLTQALARRSGFTLPTPAHIQREPSRPGEPVMALLHTLLHARAASLQRRWGPVLQTRPRPDPHTRLAFTLMGLDVAPLMLQRAPATLLAQLHSLFQPSQIPSAAADSSRVPVEMAPQGARPPQTEERPSTALAPSESAAHDSVDTRAAAQTSAASGTHDHAPTAPHHAATPAAPANTGTPFRQPSAHPAPTVASPMADTFHPLSAEPPPATRAALQPRATPANTGATAIDFTSCITRQGGLLYLLNVLNRREAQALLGDYWEQMPNGWGWLYRLGQTLGLDETDPITTLIAHQLGFDNATELNQLPPLPAADALLALAQRWYGRSGLWHPALLALHARVQASPTHVDLYAALTAVQLPVRLAGLDINPGWLPWLGKVVSFHYD